MITPACEVVAVRTIRKGLYDALLDRLLSSTSPQPAVVLAAEFGCTPRDIHSAVCYLRGHKHQRIASLWSSAHGCDGYILLEVHSKNLRLN
jgi:hypothetical protein